jgi:cobalamin synthase
MIIVGAAAPNPDETRATVGWLILLAHFLAWLIWMLVFSWRRKTAYLVGNVGCSAYRRDTNPAGYWFTMGFYSLLTALSLAIICFSIVTLARGRNAQPQLSSAQPHPASATNRSNTGVL